MGPVAILAFLCAVELELSVPREHVEGFERGDRGVPRSFLHGSRAGVRWSFASEAEARAAAGRQLSVASILRRGQRVRYFLAGEAFPLAELGEMARRAGERVATTPGVVLVDVCGAGKPERRVTLDLARLSAHGLTATRVVRSLSAEASPDQVVGSWRGVAIRLADVAASQLTAAEPECRATRAGQPGILLSVDGVDVPRAVEALERARAELPAGVTLRPADDVSVDDRRGSWAACEWPPGSKGLAWPDALILPLLGPGDEPPPPVTRLVADREAAARRGLDDDELDLLLSLAQGGVYKGTLRIVLPAEALAGIVSVETVPGPPDRLRVAGHEVHYRVFRRPPGRSVLGFAVGSVVAWLLGAAP